MFQFVKEMPANSQRATRGWCSAFTLGVAALTLLLAAAGPAKAQDLRRAATISNETTASVRYTLSWGGQAVSYVVGPYNAGQLKRNPHIFSPGTTGIIISFSDGVQIKTYPLGTLTGNPEFSGMTYEFRTSPETGRLDLFPSR